MATPPQSEVDVLIVGAGPAGLMLALWMSRLGIKTRIVDKRTDKIFSGQADGCVQMSNRVLLTVGKLTLSQLSSPDARDSRQLWHWRACVEGGQPADRYTRHSPNTSCSCPDLHANPSEVSFWNPDASGVIRRNNTAPDNVPGLSRFTECVMHQGRAEAFFLDAIAASYPHPSDAPPLHVERMVLPTSLAIDEAAAASDDAYPVTVMLRHLTEEEATPTQRLSNLGDGLFRSNLAGDDVGDMLARSAGRAGEGLREEVVKAKYVVGCDGAHSWTRKSLGPEYEMQGEMTDYIWGVLDIVPITDFREYIPATKFKHLYILLTPIWPRQGHLKSRSKSAKGDVCCMNKRTSTISLTR
jgi:phenol 2-monooxygenase (NADPH)